MTNSETVHDSDGVCPLCSTRLRISLDTADRSQFGCPECGVALVAHQQSNGTIQVTEFSTILSEASSHGVNFPRSISQLPGGSRTIAAAVTLILGVLLLPFLLPASTDSHQAEPGTDVAEPHSSDGDSSNTESTALTATSAEAADAGRKPDDGLAEPRLADASSMIALNSGASPDSTPTDPPNTQKPRLTEAPVDPAPARAITDSIPAADGNSVTLASGTKTTPNPEATIADAAGDPANVPGAAEITKAAAQPIVKPMSVRERLDISIRSFRQTKPIPLRDVIRIVERMCRVRVDISAASPVQLDKEVTVSLQQTTPTEILSKAGLESGLRVIVEDASVRMLSIPK